MADKTSKGQVPASAATSVRPSLISTHPSPATERGFLFLEHSMHKPSFITFTGIDDSTDLAEAHALAAHYPIEFGVLFSPARQGNEPRYPSWATIHRILMMAAPGGPRYAAHLCGDYSRQLLATAATNVDDYLIGHFQRVQINTSQRGIDTLALAQWASPLGLVPILQCRDTFPDDQSISWLFDASGGRGISPATWPHPPASDANDPALVGYAGGLNPSNVSAAVAAIGQHASNYWIDMESGVRDDNDCMDVSKCRAVCEAVYGR